MVLFSSWSCWGALLSDGWTRFFLGFGWSCLRKKQLSHLLLTFCFLLLLLCFLGIVWWHRSVDLEEKFVFQIDKTNDLEEKLVMLTILCFKWTKPLHKKTTWPRKQSSGWKTGLGSTHLSEKQSNSRDFSREWRLGLKEHFWSNKLCCKIAFKLRPFWTSFHNAGLMEQNTCGLEQSNINVDLDWIGYVWPVVSDHLD